MNNNLSPIEIDSIINVMKAKGHNVVVETRYVTISFTDGMNEDGTFKFKFVDMWKHTAIIRGEKHPESDMVDAVIGYVTVEHDGDGLKPGTLQDCRIGLAKDCLKYFPQYFNNTQ